jgi:RNA polymerase sigma-70 factor, ECF subfamily
VTSDRAPEQELDVALFQRIASGDALAFRELSSQHLTMVLTYATRLLGNPADAEDVAQETFLRVWQKAGTFQPRARARTWLLAIAHNLAVDRLRRRKVRSEESSSDDERVFGPSSEEPAGLLLRKLTALEVERALQALPDRQRMAILLAHEQGLSGAEIADVLSSTPEAVESLLARGRRTLRTLLLAES